MGPIGCPETSVRNNSHHTLRNNTKTTQFSTTSWRKPAICHLSLLYFHFSGVVAQVGDVTGTFIGEPEFDSRQKEELKWQERQTELRPPSNIKAKNAWSCTSTSSVVMACRFIKYRATLLFYFSNRVAVWVQHCARHVRCALY